MPTHHPDDLMHKHSEDESTSVVNETRKAGRGSLMMSWWGVCSALFYVVVGVAMAQAYGTKNAIIGLLITVVAYSLINAFIASYAAKTGLSVALFSRVLFGSKGAALATLIFFATAIYYAVFEGYVIAVAATHKFPALPHWGACLIIVAFSVPLIFGSVQHWLDKFNGVLLPLYLLGLLASVIYATSTYGYNEAWLHMGPKNPPPFGWWNVAVYYMGVWVLMMYTFDFARFGKKEDVKFHAFITFGVPFYLVAFVLSALVGIYLVSTMPKLATSESAVAFAFIELLGIFGLIFVIITQARINTANYFLGATNMQAFFKEVLGLDFSKYIWAILVGAIVFLLMLIDMFAYLLSALAYQGIFVVAWVAIALVHILSVPNYEQDVRNALSARAFKGAGLVAWFVSSAIGVLVYHGVFIPKDLGANWYATITFISACVLYFFLHKR
ncbi:purine-cytosine permease family protein [Helicobacter baculiformis]|nr:hypothetical protein [Helicobacter baculiformis]